MSGFRQRRMSRGHFSTQTSSQEGPYARHALWSMWMRSSTMVMHWAGHFLMHAPQLMQPASQTSFTALPLSWDEQKTMTRERLGMSSRMELGHVRTQVPQLVHFSGEMWTRSPSIHMASKGQARTQSPKPRQEYLQASGPSWTILAAAQLMIPKYSNFLATLPSTFTQRRKATMGSESPAALPVSSATRAATSGPPAQHLFGGMSGSLMTAAAYASQPAKPQPPQLAPGSASVTTSMRGSSST